MMPAREIFDYVVAEPFRPFRIHTASGRSFDARHPEFVQMGKNVLTVYGPESDDNNAPHKWEKISLMLIESISPLDVAAVK